MWGAANSERICAGLQGATFSAKVSPKVTTVQAGVVEKQYSTVPEHSTSTAGSNTTRATSFSMNDAQGTLKKIILDSGSFITGTKIDALGSDVEYFTIQEVIDELKDETSKIRFQTFPYKIQVVTPSQEASKFISDFAKKTGDYYALSLTDLKILALTYMIEVETHGDINIRSHPGEILIPEPTSQPDIVEEEYFNNCSFVEETTIKPFDLNLFIDGSASEYWTFAQVEHSEGIPTLTEDESKQEDSNAKPNTKTPEDVNIFSMAGFDDGQWITPENYQNINAEASNPTSKNKPSTKSGDVSSFGTSGSSVGCITTDYGMQNVLLQSGLRILAADTGLSITSLRQWMNRCHTCYTLTREMFREFCPSCGGHTMVRVAVFVDVRGKVHYKWSNKKIFNKRGTRYSIPKPKGGKNNTDLHLREDAMPGGIDRLNHMARAANKADSRSAYESAAEFAWQKAKNPQQKAVFGYGTVNPNVARRKKK